mmetsp:Transcript_60874/g.162921  ORF Transcript_60874/g.162921 Transcript_60874/m.162921 type:complete len:270 (+) Transcript_60874:492-1301(+)
MTTLSEADAMHIPSGDHETARTHRRLPRSTNNRSPLAASHTNTSPGLSQGKAAVPKPCPPETIREPSGLQSTAATANECPSKVKTRAPVTASQIIRVLSRDAVTKLVLSGLQATAQTSSACPCISRSVTPLHASQTTTAQPTQPTILLPSGLQAKTSTFFTGLSSSRTVTLFPEEMSDTKILPTAASVATGTPSPSAAPDPESTFSKTEATFPPSALTAKCLKRGLALNTYFSSQQSSRLRSCPRRPATALKPPLPILLFLKFTDTRPW